MLTLTSCRTSIEPGHFIELYEPWHLLAEEGIDWSDFVLKIAPKPTRTAEETKPLLYNSVGESTGGIFYIKAALLAV